MSSDGDPRLLRAMRIETNTGVFKQTNSCETSQVPPALQCTFESLPQIICIQDTVHIGTKLKTRMLKNSIVLPMGNYLVSASHLHILIDTVPKDKHCLTRKDLSLKDKMNFSSVLKISNSKVSELLTKHVSESERTVTYLYVIRLCLSAFLSKTLSPLERIYNIWYCVFFLRLWRAWLHANSQYSITNNFITLNAYLCIEINAQSLIDVIKLLKEIDSPELFLPWQFSSQPCEDFFRHLRSTSSTFSTIVNCSVLEAIHRVRRIQLQSDISTSNSNVSTEGYKFPRAQKSSLCSNKSTFELPSLNEMEYTIESAKQNAFITVSLLGMTVPISDAENRIIHDIHIIDSDDSTVDSFCTEEDNNVFLSSNSNEINSVNETEDNEEFDLLEDLTTLSCVQGSLELTNFDKITTEIKPDSPFTIVTDSYGKELIVRKSSICWLLSKNSCKLSSDRLQRVRESELTTYIQKSRFAQRNDEYKKCDEIFIGDWCLFKRLNNKKCYIGHILSFAYTNGKTKGKMWKSIEYSKSFAKTEGNSKDIGVLCHWYKIDRDRPLIFVPMNTQEYINIKNYVLTISRPSFVLSGLKLSENIYDNIKKYF
ncbi:uncharacterized protein LOC143893755 [Temnothorax americanus]|uniref:uncharacterized protein LOC143893755 n=1 Tax=Temnothorax americanus TaxID=1964332 RepID=UPI0040692A46